MVSWSFRRSLRACCITPQGKLSPEASEALISAGTPGSSQLGQSAGSEAGAAAAKSGQEKALGLQLQVSSYSRVFLPALHGPSTPAVAGSVQIFAFPPQPLRSKVTGLCALQVVEDANGLPTVRVIISIYSSAVAGMGAAASTHSGQQAEGESQVCTADGCFLQWVCGRPVPQHLTHHRNITACRTWHGSRTGLQQAAAALPVGQALAARAAVGLLHH